MSDRSQKYPVTDEEVPTTVGTAEDHGWFRWKEVEKYCLPGHRLFRSSSPNYKTPLEDPIDGGDRSQRLTQDAVNWLTKNKINSLISFNQFSYKPEELDLLKEANITYWHYGTKDFTSPSIENLKNAAKFHAGFEGAVTLVHCGYGHGRTGTGISAIQLYAEDGNLPTMEGWIVENRVELRAKGQIESLQELAEYYKENPHPRD